MLSIILFASLVGFGVIGAFYLVRWIERDKSHDAN